MPSQITLVSHALCPYVQRISIALAEKGVAHDRLTVDLANKPRWFLDISPLGRTPVLKVGAAALFESSAILEYLVETLPGPLHPSDPIERARHRAWIGFGSECLGDIAGFYPVTGWPDRIPAGPFTANAAPRPDTRIGSHCCTVNSMSWTSL